MKLGTAYYEQEDVVKLAKDLLGKRLCTLIDGFYTSGLIAETEAYAGTGDKASHARGGRRTKRTETMYAKGGTAYVYLCYGIHHLFNIVTNKKDVPHAILIRGIYAEEGSEFMERRIGKKVGSKILAGPGVAAKALGITTGLSGISLNDDQIWVEETKIKIPRKEILITPRIGIDYAGEDAKLPYRFVWQRRSII